MARGEIQYQHLDSYVTRVGRQCAGGCDRIRKIEVPRVSFEAWREGEKPQEAFNGLDPSDIEFFFMSGYCDSCWEELFREPE